MTAVTAQVTVCTSNTPERLLVFQAEGLASRILESAGVKIVWHGNRSCPADAIVVRVSSQTPSEEAPGALAFSRPFEGIHVVVFLDRIRQATDPRAAPALFAHVLAHEVTHLLQGLDSHSETGVMKAHWTAEDYAEMRHKPLSFTSKDVVLIHLGIEARKARLAAGK